jgi:cyclase
MLAKRIIPCLDVKEGKVVKGITFQNHRVIGDIVELAQYYTAAGADELVFYDITASCENRSVDVDWVKRIAENLDIPFCVAGGITSLAQAERLLALGADKISLNSPALANPALISEFAAAFGRQCVVIGVDSIEEQGEYVVCQYTGLAEKMRNTRRPTAQWIKEIQDRGAGEIVLNCMNQDGMRQGYDRQQLKIMRELCQIPLIASGGAGCAKDFVEVFQQCQVDGALAASVFHDKVISIE